MHWYVQIVLQAWGQIRAYPLRSALTALGIVIAVTGVITITAVMLGLQAGVNSELSKLGSDNVMIGPNFNKVMTGSGISALGRREWDGLRSHVSGIGTLVATQNVSAGKVSYRDQSVALKVVAASAQLPALYRKFPTQGRFLMDSDEAAHHRVCVISSHAIALLGLPEAPLGSQLRLGRLRLEIVGVMPAGRQSSGAVRQIGDLYLPLPLAEELSGKRNHLEFGFRVLDATRHAQVLREVKQTLRQSQATPSDDEDDFRIEDAAQIRGTNDAIVGLVSLVLLLIVSISLLVGGIGIMNVMLVSVTERTREIGIMRALGATKRHIRVQFLVEASILSGLGALLGVLLGWGLANLLVQLIPHADGARLAPWAVLSSVAVALLVGLMSGALPAARAAELDPVLALSKE